MIRRQVPGRFRRLREISKRCRGALNHRGNEPSIRDSGLSFSFTTSLLFLNGRVPGRNYTPDDFQHLRYLNCTTFSIIAKVTHFARRASIWRCAAVKASPKPGGCRWGRIGCDQSLFSYNRGTTMTKSQNSHTAVSLANFDLHQSTVPPFHIMILRLFMQQSCNRHQGINVQIKFAQQKGQSVSRRGSVITRNVACRKSINCRLLYEGTKNLELRDIDC
jgi:hypothetical protein